MKLPRFVIYLGADGWRWRLKGANGRTVATGESHGSRRDALRAVRRMIELVRGPDGHPPGIFEQHNGRLLVLDAAP